MLRIVKIRYCVYEVPVLKTVRSLKLFSRFDIRGINFKLMAAAAHNLHRTNSM